MIKTLLGEWPQMVRFVSLVLAVAMMATAAANMVWGRAWLAVAAAAVAGWSLSLCLDVWRAEVVRDVYGMLEHRRRSRSGGSAEAGSAERAERGGVEEGDTDPDNSRA